MNDFQNILDINLDMFVDIVISSDDLLFALGVCKQQNKYESKYIRRDTKYLLIIKIFRTNKRMTKL